MTSTPLRVPQISHEELRAFHDAHFSLAAADHFGSQFFPPPNSTGDNGAIVENDEEYYYELEEEDDGLGYYPDGVKRTLTDEQIAMFRHSELEALRRAQEKGTGRASEKTEADDAESGEQLSEGEVSETPAPTTKRKKNKRRRNQKHRPQTEGQQIDLRKRTWDIVETGLDSLDYGESEGGPSAATNPSQRRRISYDD